VSRDRTTTIFFGVLAAAGLRIIDIGINARRSAAAGSGNESSEDAHAWR
jgi:hypothetical protein